MSSGRASVGLVLSVCSLAACGGSGSLTLDEYAARANDVLCNLYVRCGELPDKASCASLVGDLGQAKADVASGKTKYDGVAAAKCLDAFDAYSCRHSSQPDTLAACEQAAQGTLADGAACNVGSQCVSRTCVVTACDRSVMCCEGTCSPTQQEVGEGADCSQENTRCGDGLYCEPGAARKCVKLGGVGAACGVLAPCEATLHCLRDTPTSNTGTCGAYPKRGEPCIDDVFACDDVRDACDPVTSKCIARLAVGADCSSFNGCVAYAYCDQTTEKCVKKVGAGQPCTSDGNCLGGLDCDPAEGKCVERPPQIVCP